MADRYPLIYNPSANQIQELQSGDSLDVGNSVVKGATGYATTTGTSSQFLKADGSLDSSTYLTASGTAQLAQGLTGTPTIDVGDVTGVNATFSGNLTVNGTTTTIDTAVTEVDSLEIAANNNNVAVAITQSGAGKAMTVEGGDVGIGTNNPVERLHLAKNSATGPSFYITNDSTGHTNADGLQIGFDGSNNAQIRNRENTQLKLYTNNTPRLTVTNNGFVGIGTDAPDAKLSVFTGGVEDSFRIGTPSGSDTLIRLGSTGTDPDTHAVIKYDKEDNYLSLIVSGETHGGGGVLIANGGNVGVGVTNPTESLQVEGNLRMGSTVDAPDFTNTGSKHITIGSQADALLVTHSSGQGLGYFGYEAGGDRLVVACDGGSGGNKIDFITDAGTTSGGSTDNLNGRVPKMRITAAGNIGIGVTDPSEKLEVNGGKIFIDGGGNRKITLDPGSNSTYDSRIDASHTLVFRSYVDAGAGVKTCTFNTNGHLIPGDDNGQDLGASNARWRNIYTGDLNLSNEGSANDVDGTWGQYTIQEGEDDLFLINRRTGKKYKFNLTEVN